MHNNYKSESVYFFGMRYVIMYLNAKCETFPTLLLWNVCQTCIHHFKPVLTIVSKLLQFT